MVLYSLTKKLPVPILILFLPSRNQTPCSPDPRQPLPSALFKSFASASFPVLKWKQDKNGIIALIVFVGGLTKRKEEATHETV